LTTGFDKHLEKLKSLQTLSLNHELSSSTSDQPYGFDSSGKIRRHEPTNRKKYILNIFSATEYD